MESKATLKTKGGVGWGDLPTVEELKIIFQLNGVEKREREGYLCQKWRKLSLFSPFQRLTA